MREQKRGQSEPDIAFFTSSMGDGGAQRTIANLVKGFAEKGYSVDLLLIDATGPYLEDIPKDVRIVDLDSNRALTSIPYLTQYLNKTEPDVLFSTMEYLNIASLISNVIASGSTKTVIRGANVQDKNNKTGIKNHAINFLARQLYPQANQLIALSRYVQKDMLKNYNLDDKNISVIYNPVLVSEIQEKTKTPIQHDIINEHSATIISVGSLTKQKDMRITIKAFAELTDQRNAELIILGKGDQREQLLQLAKDLDVDDRVHLLGFVDNPFAYMNMADVFVLSSKWEGFGHVIVEAMACGTPVVATDCPGGPSEILDDGKYGELTPVGDHMSLASAIRRTLDSPPDESILLNRSENFNYEQITDQYEKAIFNQ